MIVLQNEILNVSFSSTKLQRGTEEKGKVSVEIETNRLKNTDSICILIMDSLGIGGNFAD